MKIETEVTKTYEMNYMYKDDPNGGFGFPCDEFGNIDSPEGTGWERNYRKCEAHKDDFIIGLQTRTDTARYGYCDKCNRKIYVFPDKYGEVECPKCGQRYNAFGQQIVKSAWDAPEYGDAEWDW